MRSSSSRRSNLQPLMIPELLASSPKEAGYHSPAESDSLQTPTPIYDHGEIHLQFKHVSQDHLSPCIHPYIRKGHCDIPLSPSPPQVFLPSPKSLELSLHPSPSSSRSATFSLHGSLSSSSGSFVRYNSEPQSGNLRCKHANPRASSDPDARTSRTPQERPLNLKGSAHSPRFPPNHELNPYFLRDYQLEDELGSGGYGFVMTALRHDGLETAVKFILKEKIPDHAWMNDEVFRVLPLEVMLLRAIDHDNIVKCVEVFEDPVYYYLVQELHGSPWHKAVRNGQTSLVKSSVCALSSSVSADYMAKPRGFSAEGRQPHQSAEDVHLKRKTPVSRPALSVPRKPEYSRRPSYDLFECIEQSEHKRLPECQARFVLAQVVEAAYYLDIHGVTHRDIKDENLVIDRNLKVKLIDFGSAVVEDPETRPYHTLFFGTTAYASSEILLKKPYQAPPAEVWTVGVLLSFLLTGSSPFPTIKDAIDGRIVLSDCPKDVSAGALDLMRLCLDPNPKTRATIGEVRIHPWLNSH